MHISETNRLSLGEKLTLAARDEAEKSEKALIPAQAADFGHREREEAGSLISERMKGESDSLSLSEAARARYRMASGGETQHTGEDEERSEGFGGSGGNASSDAGGTIKDLQQRIKSVQQQLTAAQGKMQAAAAASSAESAAPQEGAEGEAQPAQADLAAQAELSGAQTEVSQLTQELMQLMQQLMEAMKPVEGQ